MPSSPSASAFPLTLVRVRLLLLLVAVGVVSAFAYLLISQQKADDARHYASLQLRFYRQSLSTLLSRLDQFPQLLARDPSLKLALQTPTQSGLIQSANQSLKGFRQITGLSDAYLLDTRGMTIAASNAGEAGSFVGRRFDYRPYYQEALAGKLSRFYGMGTTSHIPGYYLAYPVKDNGQIIGVAVVKTILDSFETQLRESGQSLFVVDRNGVICLTSIDSWSYAALHPLTQSQQAEANRAKQYPSTHLPAWANRTLVEADWQSGSLALQPKGLKEGNYQLLAEPVGVLGWKMLWVSNLKTASDAAIQQAALLGLGLFLIGFAIIYRLERLQTMRYRKNEAARLNEAIATQTHQLASTNQELQEKVADLETTRKQWQDAQEKSVQMAKMALLGQLSSGLAHEINQPLAALMALADNANTFLARNQPDMAQQNLELISITAERMSDLTKQLKLFARQAPLTAQPVLVGESLRHAVNILNPRLQQASITLTWPALLDEEWVMAEVTPLSQVWVNLMVNALDAMQAEATPMIEIAASKVANTLQITLRDTGSGLDSRVQARLFEPFFTTKPSGEGLGLGLVITQAIIAGFNGQFALYNHPEKGSIAMVVLPLASPSATEI